MPITKSAPWLLPIPAASITTFIDGFSSTLSYNMYSVLLSSNAWITSASAPVLTAEDFPVIISAFLPSEASSAPCFNTAPFSW